MKAPLIYPMMWFNNQAVEAANWYCSIFDHSRILKINPSVISFEIEGFRLDGLNGGSLFSPSPGMSFFVQCDSEEEIEKKYTSLQEGGKLMIPLNTYPWAEKYAFFQDKFGVAWQLNLRSKKDASKKITASLLFVNQNNGKAEEAMDRYLSVFPESTLLERSFYEENSNNKAGNVLFSKASISGFHLIAMDGPGENDFNFTEGNSFVVVCDGQSEVDHFWQKLIENGGEESRCGWLKDPFGLSWQIIPKQFFELLGAGTPSQSHKVMEVMLKMNKFIIKDLEIAFHHGT